MRGPRRWFAGRFAHPRLAAVIGAGLALLAAGLVLSTVLPADDVVGFRLLVVGYLLALGGGAGYLSVAVFEFRDRTPR